MMGVAEVRAGKEAEPGRDVTRGLVAIRSR